MFVVSILVVDRPQAGNRCLLSTMYHVSCCNSETSCFNRFFLHLEPVAVLFNLPFFATIFIDKQVGFLSYCNNSELGVGVAVVLVTFLLADIHRHTHTLT